MSTTALETSASAFRLARDRRVALRMMLFFLGAAALTVAPVMAGPDWPMNHELDSFFKRTLVYAGHMAQGDWLPLWSAADNAGYGSPQPALYHKAFYLVSGAAFLMLGSLKGALVVSLVAWLAAGAGALYYLCRVIGCDRQVAAAGAVMLLLANYTLTNWLVRGAMAELAAAMLVPWVIAEYLRSLRLLRITLGLGTSLALLVLAHSAIALYLALILTVVALALLLAGQLSPAILRPSNSLPAVALCLVLVAPYATAMLLLGAGYDMTRITPPLYLPENNIQLFGKYFHDPAWTFGATWQSYTVQLDHALWALLLVGLVGVGGRWMHGHTRPEALHLRDALTLGLILLLALLLQTAWAIPFYRHVPVMGFIQFPWRLLAIVTPVLIALGLLLLGSLPRRWRQPGLAAALTVMVLDSGAFARITYPSLPLPDQNLPALRFSAFGEYVPRDHDSLAPPPAEAVHAAMAGEGCRVQATASPAETLVRRFRVDCQARALVTLPLFASPYHRVFINGQTRPCARREDYPALCAVDLPPGETWIEVHMPSLGGMVSLLTTAERW